MNWISISITFFKQLQNLSDKPKLKIKALIALVQRVLESTPQDEDSDEPKYEWKRDLHDGEYHLMQRMQTNESNSFLGCLIFFLIADTPMEKFYTSPLSLDREREDKSYLSKLGEQQLLDAWMTFASEHIDATEHEKDMLFDMLERHMTISMFNKYSKDAKIVMLPTDENTLKDITTQLMVS